MGAHLKEFWRWGSFLQGPGSSFPVQTGGQGDELVARLREEGWVSTAQSGPTGVSRHHGWTAVLDIGDAALLADVTACLQREGWALGNAGPGLGQLVVTDKSDCSLQGDYRVLLVQEHLYAALLDDPHVDSFVSVLSWTPRVDVPPGFVSLARRLHTREWFGIGSLLAHGEQVHEAVVRSSGDRAQIHIRVQEFVRGLATANPLQQEALVAAAAEVVEEFVMNGVWDANPRLRTADRALPVQLEPGEAVHVSWGWDGCCLVLAVADPFGGFGEGAAKGYLRYLFSAKRGNVAIQTGEGGGAGIGLFMALRRTNLFSIIVQPGFRTEVLALFEVNPAVPRAKRRSSQSFQFLQI